MPKTTNFLFVNVRLRQNLLIKFLKVAQNVKRCSRIADQSFGRTDGWEVDGGLWKNNSCDPKRKGKKSCCIQSRKQFWKETTSKQKNSYLGKKYLACSTGWKKFLHRQNLPTPSPSKVEWFAPKFIFKYGQIVANPEQSKDAQRARRVLYLTKLQEQNFLIVK